MHKQPDTASPNPRQDVQPAATAQQEQALDSLGIVVGECAFIPLF